MNTSLSETSLKNFAGQLTILMADHAKRFSGEPARRQPIHTVYGGAHLFKADTAVRLGKFAEHFFSEYALDAAALTNIFGIDPSLSETIYTQILEKLTREAVEDFRIDFEDGYGIRSAQEEDGHAVSSALELAKGMTTGTLPPFTGIRIKSLSAESYLRSIRTLDLFLTTLIDASNGKLPENFVVTLPKIELPEQVRLLVDVLDEIESKLGIAAGNIKIELMIETTRSIFGTDGSATMPLLLSAARGRCSGAHFGAYDYTASCGITAASQDLLHPACDFARNMMQVSFGGTGVFLSDGATNILPIAPHRGENLTPEQIIENRNVVQCAWKIHYDHCRHSLANGFFQGWDLHPAQIVSRYAAVFAFFLESLDAAAERLKHFVEISARATLVGEVFDDAATGQGLLNFFLRAINCGAISENDATRRTGLTIENLSSMSFAKILKN